MKKRSLAFALGLILGWFGFMPVVAAQTLVRVAVAANFTAPMQAITQRFERDTGHRVKLSFGSTGHLYAQIKHGAPFDILLAADTVRPDRLVREGLALASSRFTYASGKLALWSAQAHVVDAQGQVLRQGSFAKLAVADPRLAPYGEAAMAVVKRIKLEQALTSKLVFGTSIAQTFQFVSSGNASLGFVALSQVYENGQFVSGSGWVIPEDLYPPIHQDAVLLTRGQNNTAAQVLMAYLRSEPTRALIRAYGYGV